MKLHHNIKCIPGFIFKVCKTHRGQQAGEEQAYGRPVDSGHVNLSCVNMGRGDNSWEEAAQPRTEGCCCTTERPWQPGPRATSQAGQGVLSDRAARQGFLEEYEFPPARRGYLCLLIPLRILQILSLVPDGRGRAVSMRRGHGSCREPAATPTESRCKQAEGYLLQ